MTNNDPKHTNDTPAENFTFNEVLTPEQREADRKYMASGTAELRARTVLWERLTAICDIVTPILETLAEKLISEAKSMRKTS